VVAERELLENEQQVDGRHGGARGRHRILDAFCGGGGSWYHVRIIGRQETCAFDSTASMFLYTQVYKSFYNPTTTSVGTCWIRLQLDQDFPNHSHLSQC
jgi:hypothetical protein